LGWRAKMERYAGGDEIGVGSVIGVARKPGVHRRMVGEAERNAVPAQRRRKNVWR